METNSNELPRQTESAFSNASSTEEIDDLEAKLGALVADVRQLSEEELRKKRAESVLEARMYVPDVVPPAHPTPASIGLTKVVLARGVDPTQDPTLVGKRTGSAEWEFGIAELAQDEQQDEEPPTLRDGRLSGERLASQTEAKDDAAAPKSRKGARLLLIGSIAVLVLVGITYYPRHPTLETQPKQAAAQGGEAEPTLATTEALSAATQPSVSTSEEFDPEMRELLDLAARVQEAQAATSAREVSPMPTGLNRPWLRERRAKERKAEGAGAATSKGTAKPPLPGGRNF